MNSLSRYHTTLLFIAAAVFFTAWYAVPRYWLSVDEFYVECVVSAEVGEGFQVFYDQGHGWHPDHMVEAQVPAHSDHVTVRFPMIHTRKLTGVRLDLGTTNSEVTVHRISFHSGNKTIQLPLDLKQMSILCMDLKQLLHDGSMQFAVTCDDPQIVYEKLPDAVGWGQYTSSDKWKLSVFGLVFLLLLIFFWTRQPFKATIAHSKPHHVLFALFFILLLNVHWYSTYIDLFEADPALEKRSLAPFPSYQVDSFPTGFDAWFQDHLAIRQPLIHGQSLLDLCLFHSSALPQKVIFGKNLDMFPAGSLLLDDFQGKLILSREQLEEIHQTLLDRVQFMQKSGADYFMLFVPSKQSVYPQDLPLKVSKGYDPTKTRLGQLMPSLDRDPVMRSHVLDIREALRSEAETSDVRLYCSNDMHWNGNGAYYGYLGLFRMIGALYPYYVPKKITDFRITETQDHEGDLAMQLLLQDEMPRTLVHYDRKDGTTYTLQQNEGNYRFPYSHTTNADSTLPTAIVFRDSFSEELVQFLSPHFSEVLYVWDHNFDEDLITKRKPDLVIHELSEMFIHELLPVDPKSMQRHG